MADRGTSATGSTAAVLKKLAVFDNESPAARSDTSQANPPPSSDQSSPTDLSAHQQHIEQQPQGSTGPLDTTSGGAPAESPQGQSPPGMQAAPEDSSKVITNGK
jgi:hypothetical protein